MNDDAACEPTCVSRHFVHKLCARAAGQVPALRAARRASPERLLRLVLSPESLPASRFAVLVRTLTPFLERLRRNVDRWCARPRPRPSRAPLVPVSKAEVSAVCLRAVLRVAPRGWLLARHRRLVAGQVQRLVCGARGQHVSLRSELGAWRPRSLNWRCELAPAEALLLLYRILLWLYNNVLSTAVLLRYFVTVTRLTPNRDELFYFPIAAWQGFRDRALCRLVRAHVLRPLSERPTSSLPTLHLLPKPNGRFRPIVRHARRRDVVDRECKRLLNRLIEMLRPERRHFNDQYSRFATDWQRVGRPALYFVRADLHDAFGSVDRDRLVDMIDELCRLRARIRSDDEEAERIRCELTRRLREPCVLRCGRRTFAWCRGLTQGDPLSPLLAELYYSVRDHAASAAFAVGAATPALQLTYRSVDDYLYICDSRSSASDFLTRLARRERLNPAKTVTNFEHERASLGRSIEFVGYEYDTSTLEVSRPATACVPAADRIAFTSAISDVREFVSSRLALSPDPHLLNLTYNSAATVWRHVWSLWLAVADALCAMLRVLCAPGERLRGYADVYAETTARLAARTTRVLARHEPAGVKWEYCGNHVRALSYLALLRRARECGRCSELAAAARALLARVDCARGRWSPHWSAPGRAASRRVCRAPDFKRFFRICETSPVLRSSDIDHNKQIEKT